MEDIVKMIDELGDPSCFNCQHETGGGKGIESICRKCLGNKSNFRLWQPAIGDITDILRAIAAKLERLEGGTAREGAAAAQDRAAGDGRLRVETPAGTLAAYPASDPG